MPSCREVDPLFAAYVDGGATADERAVVDAHLLACPKCRHQTALQAAVRQTVREKLCRPCAPEALRLRCRAAAREGLGPFGIPLSTLKSLSMAAALVLVLGGVLLYGLAGFSTVLAAQLAIDHVACFALHDSTASIDAQAGEAKYARDYGQAIQLPRISVEGLQLVNVRRCYCGEGAAAHAMYRLNGAPVSLYMIRDADRARDSADIFGHDAIIWSKQGTSYVLVSGEPRGEVEKLAAAFEAGL